MHVWFCPRWHDVGLHGGISAAGPQLSGLAGDRDPPPQFARLAAQQHPAAEDVETANSLLSRTRVKLLKDQLKDALPQLPKTQAKLVNDSDMAPTLWKPPFSASKYNTVLSVCRELLERLDVLVDLVEWHENRRSSGKDKELRRWQQSRLEAECTAAFAAAQEPPSPSGRNGWRKRLG
jgi:hypothetical protein